MASHSQGPGTKNASVNLLDSEFRAFGRIAVLEDRSMGETIRRLATEGLRLRHEAVYEEIALARRQHRTEQLHLELEPTKPS